MCQMPCRNEQEAWSLRWACAAARYFASAAEAAQRVRWCGQPPLVEARAERGPEGAPGLGQAQPPGSADARPRRQPPVMACTRRGYAQPSIITLPRRVTADRLSRHVWSRTKDEVTKTRRNGNLMGLRGAPHAVSLSDASQAWFALQTVPSVP